MRSRPAYSCATGTVPFTSHTAPGAITSKSARGSPPRNASKTRRMPSSAFKRCERKPEALELRVIEIGRLAMTRPDDRLAGRVDAVRERHAAVVVDTGNRLGEREGDALEGVVVVVSDDDAPGPARAGAAAAAQALLRRCERRGHDGSSVAITASAITFSGRPDTWLARRRR